VRGAGKAPGGNRAQTDILKIEPKVLRLAASSALVALIILCLAWELWLAPLRPGGSYLALKVLPLTLCLPGILTGKRYTYQWSSMLILAYFAEGVARAWGERGVSQLLAFAEVALASLFFASAVAYARSAGPGAR